MSDEIRAIEERHFLQTYRRLPIEIDRADGVEIVAADGRRYLDFLGGIAVNAAGHSHPAIIEAIVEQASRYTHVSNFFYQDAQIRFVERLTSMSRYNRAFLANSGTEAIDGALKLVRKWGSSRGRDHVISFTGGFHGRTYGALSLMDKPPYKEGMGPFLSGVTTLPYNDPDTLRGAVTDRTAAIFVEFLQGEGGVRPATPEFIEAIEWAQKERGVLVVADEIQTGGGRTGRFFSFDGLGIRPDVVTLAKVIGGGLPLGALLTSEDLSDVWGAGEHGTTFGGNAVACAAGSAFLDLLRDGLMKRAEIAGDRMLELLDGLRSEFPELILEVRGAGCMIGVEFAVETRPIVEQLLERGIIANSTASTVLRLLPPYIVEEDHILRLIEAIRDVLRDRTSAE